MYLAEIWCEIEPGGELKIVGVDPDLDTHSEQVHISSRNKFPSASF